MKTTWFRSLINLALVAALALPAQQAGSVAGTHDPLWNSPATQSVVTIEITADGFSPKDQYTTFDQPQVSWHNQTAQAVTGQTVTYNGTTHTHAFTYDLAGRLASESLEGQVTTYVYDSNGDRTQANYGGPVPASVYDGQDRLVSRGGRTYTFDANGALAHSSVKIVFNTFITSYSYNSLGELASVSLPDGRVIRYSYDGLGRRILKMVDGVQTLGLVYQSDLQPAARL